MQIIVGTYFGAEAGLDLFSENVQIHKYVILAGLKTRRGDVGGLLEQGGGGEGSEVEYGGGR